ncbi:uncharacterized protein LOC115538683, partial [Gadus morhua]|uniref:uncharacterized protein LOC115538683 n=1 Tax=Gadus morhua TaxID=8049 RepID=UPI0011B4B0C0
MTKPGKPDSYWRDLCIKYAQGLYRFSTGKRPGAKKWKKALENIDACHCRAIVVVRICSGEAFSAPVASTSPFPWSQDILSQLDVAHRSLFPAVLTTQLALDRKAVTFLKPRTSGNSSSYLQSAMEEAHSEEWARQTIRYLSDCVSSVAKLFHPWQTTVRLDSFHFMRRFNCGLTTEHHPLYGIFCAKLSSCIFARDQEDVQRLKEAKREEWKSSHSGHTPTEEQLMATISPGELKRHCRRRTRGVEETRGMISGLLESVWELTDTTGLRLVSHDSMRHVWEVQQKHLECLQDPAGVALYTKVGTLQKGGKELDVLRCGRGSSSLESFHKHQCAFIPGWRCNAVHTQMYMLEGVSRWNMGRAKEAVDVEGASTLRSFDVRLMSHLSNLSQRVLGSTLVPEFTPPGKPTSERIAVEYLLAQTNRGDLLAPNQVPEVPSQVLEEEDEPDDTISMTDILCQSAAIGAGDPPGAVVGDAEPGPLVTQVQVLEAEEEPDDTISMTDHTGDPPGAVEDDDEPGPLVTETSQCDSRGVVGWDAVDNLAGYLVGLNRTITALSMKEEADIVQLYTALHDMDKKHSSYTQKARKKGQTSGGPWRAPRRPSGSAPGQQAAE